MSFSSIVGYWCHQCLMEIRPTFILDPSCPHCHGKFVEKIEEDDDARALYQENQQQEPDENVESPVRLLLSHLLGYLQEYNSRESEENAIENSAVREANGFDDNRAINLDSSNSDVDMIEEVFQQRRPPDTEDPLPNLVDETILQYVNQMSRPRINSQDSNQGENNERINLNVIQRIIIDHMSNDIEYDENSLNTSDVNSTPRGIELTDEDFEVIEGHLNHNISVTPESENPRTSRDNLNVRYTENNISNNDTSERQSREHILNEGPDEIIYIDDNSDIIDLSNDLNSQENRDYNITDVIRMFTGLYSDPGDYVFGTTAFDNILTHLLNTSRGNNLPPPAPESIIDNLPKVCFIEEEEFKDECSVCKDNYRYGDTVSTLPCSHHYHNTCIVPWLKQNGTCPVCRFSLIEPSSN